MNKLDMKKEYKKLYTAKVNQVEEIKVPVLNYLQVDGKGIPNSPLFEECVQALYGLAYSIKFECKAKDKDFVVMPLQGLWYMENMEEWSMEHKEKWAWTLMIAMPVFVSDRIVEVAKEKLKKKKSLKKLNSVRFERYNEGQTVQIMHIGPYDEETENIRTLHRYVAEHGYKLRGKHHEIYLGDPRKVAPEKLKTIIRQPVA